MSKKLCYLAITLVVLWSLSPAMGQAPAGTPGKGNILVERWMGGGVDNNLANLKNNANYPNNPMGSYWYQEYQQPDIGANDYWGERFRGYLWPPQNGDYTFWVASDDDSEFWLSTDDKPANIALVCSVTGWTDYQNYDGTVGSPGSNQKSKIVKLQAGKRYYTEALFSDGTGGGHLSVAWQGPGIATRTPIVGKYLSAWIRTPEPMFMAQNPSPADGATGIIMPLLTWTAGATAVFHDVYFGTDPNPPKVGRQTWAMYYGAALVPGTTYYWRIDEVEANLTTIHQGKVWSFMAAPLSAFSPVPRNGDKWIDLDSDLAWQAGTNAQAHDVYFGTDKNLVAARDASVLKGNKIAAPTLELPKLQPGTTYYWLVDEYDNASVKHEGSVWSFTTVVPGTGGVKAEYFRNMTLTGAPFLTQIEPDVNHSWGDPGGPAPGVVDNFSARWTADLEILFADSYTFIATSDDGTRLWLNDKLICDGWWDRGTTDSVSQPQKLDPGIYSIRMEYYENGGGAVAQLSWQTPTMARQIIPSGPLSPPVRAKPVNPQNGDANVPQDIILTWSAGEKAVTHNVYFGEDAAAVEAATPSTAGIYKGSQAKDNVTWSPGGLEWGKTYYWKVDEVNAASSESPWKGTVWSFTTANFLVVDDFESYTDDDTGRIFQTWIDGWGFTTPAPGNPGNGTGATVGYTDPPFSEHGIVHGGKSSMPLGYDNAASPNYSEAERTFDSPQNWTVNGVNTLSLAVRGYAEVNAVTVTETGGKMSLTGSGADIWGASDEFTYAYKSLNGDATIVAKVVSNGTGSDAWAKGGVMIRDGLEGRSASAQMVLTGGNGNGGAFQNRASEGLDMGANDATSNTTVTTQIAPPYWVKLERIGDTFTGYVSPDGSAWTMVATAEVVMKAPVYIGLCVTAHHAGEQRTFQFESIKTTGSVTGAWQGAVIDSPRYNSPQDLYVAIQDSTNKVAVVKNSTAVNSATWTVVQMPLSGFTGVNMTKVKKIFIGVGDRTNPVADGTGMLFIDDIRVIKP